MKLLVGWGLSGPSFTPHTDATARLGEPTWGRSELLRDLELRLGLPREDALASVRVPRWYARIAKLPSPTAFYAKSFEVDPLGTAQMLLAWRDALIESGWNGLRIAGGGDRLDALAAIEACSEIALPLGTADRLVRAGLNLRTSSSKTPLYDDIALVEPRALWSQRWQQLFSLLETSGTRIVEMHPDLPGAPTDTDLGRLQQRMRGETRRSSDKLPPRITGDGSLLLLRGETPAELAELTASLLASWRDDALVIRSLDSAPLEAALLRHHLPSQGRTGSSHWRPAMQVLPLALELAFEPRDPYRVLELLTLPVGPFRGFVGSMLAKAVSKQPGIGGQEWTQRKLRIADTLRQSETRKLTEAGSADAAALAEAHVAERMSRIEEWLEAPGAGKDGAPRATLLALALRIRTWLQQRLATGDPDVYGAAFAQAEALTDALSNETRATFSREDARHLLDTVVRAAHGHALSVECAGRMAHVAHPSAILAPAASVVFWGFVAGTERRPALVPWNHAELNALTTAGVVFPDSGKLLATESDAWRRGVLAARQRVVFVVPSKMKGAAMSPHPMWDEIRARLGLEDSAAIERVTRHAQSLLRSEGPVLSSIVTIRPLALPEGRGEWNLGHDLFTSEDDRGSSATALTTLVSCPLAWVLRERAGLRSGAIAKVAEGPLLNGRLSHRLVEDLFWENAFDLDEEAFGARTDAVLEALIRAEGATLLLPGGAFERAQLVQQIRGAMHELRRYLRSAGFRIASVEEPVQTRSAVGTLHGRLDLRLMDASGNDAVLDLKWGEVTYQDLLKSGSSVQLAAYAQALRSKMSDGRWPPAAYFALASGRVLTVDTRMKAPQTLDGPSLEATWNTVERTAVAVKKSLEQGRVFVAATKRALPLLKALDVPDADHATYFASTREAPCKYCEYPAICGVAWEGFQ